jgi:hypothetical protein
MPRGAKPGERRGGRSKNTPNKRTTELQALIDEAKAKGFIQPLEYMLTSSTPPRMMQLDAGQLKRRRRTAIRGLARQ